MAKTNRPIVSARDRDMKKWQAQDDARTLAQAQEIAMDKARMSMATKAANQMAKEAQAHADKLNNVAKGKVK